jgi:hypothetical protein
VKARCGSDAGGRYAGPRTCPDRCWALACSSQVQDATPAAACSTTTEDEKKDLVRAYYAAAESGNVENFANALGPDRVDHGPVGIEPDERVGGAKDAAGWVSE